MKFKVKIENYRVDNLVGYRAYVVGRSNIFSFSRNMDDLKVKIREMIAAWTYIEEPDVTFILTEKIHKKKTK